MTKNRFMPAAVAASLALSAPAVAPVPAAVAQTASNSRADEWAEVLSNPDNIKLFSETSSDLSSGIERDGFFKYIGELILTALLLVGMLAWIGFINPNPNGL